MTPSQWLSIVGIGEDGADGLSPAARRLVEGAELVVGGARHLALAGDLARGERLPWPSPLTDAFGAILAKRGRPVCVLATGDPFHFGIGPQLAALVPPGEFVCLPQPSAFSLAAARLGWSLPEAACFTLHGRPLERVLPHLQPGARLLALSWNGDTPARLAALLAARGFGPSRITVLEAMGGPRERTQRARADAFDLVGIDPLNIVFVEVEAGPAALVVPLTPGLPDELFEHDGQLTKREVRAATIAALGPRVGELLWDIGAGSGSISIEWSLRHPSLRAVAIEPRPERAARIARNAAHLGAPDVAIVHGEAPAALIGLPAPDAVFVGGGATDPGVLDAAWAALRAGGRIVANGVTLETEALLLDRFSTLGGALTRLHVERAEPIGRGRLHGWRSAMPVTQWRAVKP